MFRQNLIIRLYFTFFTYIEHFVCNKKQRFFTHLSFLFMEKFSIKFNEKYANITNRKKKRMKEVFTTRLNALTSFLCMFTFTQSHPGESPHTKWRQQIFPWLGFAYAFHALTVSFLSTLKIHAVCTLNIGNFI